MENHYIDKIEKIRTIENINSKHKKDAETKILYWQSL